MWQKYKGVKIYLCTIIQVNSLTRAPVTQLKGGCLFDFNYLIVNLTRTVRQCINKSISDDKPINTE